MLTSTNEQLIHAYLEIVATDDYKDFGTLLTEDCTFSLMPSGHTFKGRQAIMAFTEIAGGSRTHDKQSKVAIKNWFTDSHYLCVEYDHTAIVQALHWERPRKRKAFCPSIASRSSGRILCTASITTPGGTSRSGKG